MNKILLPIKVNVFFPSLLKMIWILGLSCNYNCKLVLQSTIIDTIIYTISIYHGYRLQPWR